MMAYWGRVWPILIAMVLGCLVATSSGYPSGAPQGACPTLKPGHGTAQLTNSPYSIEVDSTVFKSGQPLKVRILGGAFQGLMLQARQRSGGRVPVGRWSGTPAYTRTQTCSLEDDTITHSTTTSKTEPEFSWTPPDDQTGDIYFIVTVARDKYTWWLGVESSDISLSTTTTTTTTTTSPTTTTTTSTSPTTSSPTTTVPAISVTTAAATNVSQTQDPVGTDGQTTTTVSPPGGTTISGGTENKPGSVGLLALLLTITLVWVCAMV